MQSQSSYKSFPTRKIKLQAKQFKSNKDNKNQESNSLQLFNLQVSNQDSYNYSSQISSQGSSIKLPQIINYQRSKLKQSNESRNNFTNKIRSINLSKKNSQQSNQFSSYLSGQISSDNTNEIIVPNFIRAKNILLHKKYETPTPLNDIDEEQQPMPLQIEYPNVVLTIEPLYQKGFLIENQSQSLPACITVRIEDKKNTHRLNVDLILILNLSLDISSEQFQIMKTKINKFIDYLNDQDRLCLIEMDKRITSLKYMTDRNKNFIKNIINEFQPGEQNDIAKGLEQALQQISNRNHKNDITTVFLITDCQDDTLLFAYIAKLENFNQISVHSFGIGNKHNPTKLCFLSNLRDGNYYFVNNLDLLAYFMIDAFALVVSTIATDISIRLLCQDNQFLQQLMIRKVHDDKWKTIQEDHDYKIHLQQMSYGTKKDFMFEVLIPKSFLKLEEPKRVVISKAYLTFKYIGTNKFVEKQQNLELILVKDQQQLEENKRNLNVAVQFIRVQLTEIIFKCLNLCRQNQNQQALELLNAQLNKLQIQFDKNDIWFIQLELIEALKACQRQDYQQYGFQQITSILFNISNQNGIITKFTEGNQIAFMNQGCYQNSLQHFMCQQLLYKE